MNRNDLLLVDTNKAQWLAACGHVSASSQSLRFIFSLRVLLTHSDILGFQMSRFICIENSHAN